MSIDQPVGDWFIVFANLDVPPSDYSFGGMLTTLLYLAFPQDWAAWINEKVFLDFMWKEEVKIFIRETYTP